MDTKNLTKKFPVTQLIQLRKFTEEAVVEREIDVQQYKREVAPLIQKMKKHLKNYQGKLIYQKV